MPLSVSERTGENDLAVRTLLLVLGVDGHDRAWTAERNQWLAERQRLESRLGDAGQSESVRKQLEDERDSLTCVLHAVTGRWALLEADARNADAAARDAIERRREDAAALAQLQAERGTLAGSLESVQAQLFDAMNALTNERWARTQERDTAAWQHQQALDAASAALHQERQDVAAQRSEAQAAFEADHARMLKLRDDLLRFVADADAQCRTLIERHEARRAPGAGVPNQSFT